MNSAQVYFINIWWFLGVSESLSDQLNETANAKILRLELENKRLLKRLQEQKETQLVDNSAKFLELEKENHRFVWILCDTWFDCIWAWKKNIFFLSQWYIIAAQHAKNVEWYHPCSEGYWNVKATPQFTSWIRIISYWP